MKSLLEPRPYRGIPWLLLGAGLMPAVATTAVGIVLLVLGGPIGGFLALGILLVCFAAFAIAGLLTTLFLLRRQSRLVWLQNDFIANVSHELRTPLASIRMFSETLRLGRASSPEDRETCLAALEQETERLTELVEQLLQFRQASRTQNRTQTDPPMAPEQLVQLALAPIRRQSQQNARLVLVVEPALPMIQVDRREFGEAIANLVRNALTYGGTAGPVIVTVRAEDNGVAFAVRDAGPGIPRREHRRIFRRFVRGSQSTKTPGFGLGLAIVRAFAQRAGGHIRLTSPPGQGATFTLWLPSAPLPTEPRQPVVASTQPPPDSAYPADPV